VIRTEFIAPIAELLHRHAESRPDKIAFRDHRRSITYRDLFYTTGNLASHLVALGLTPGDRVSLWLPNTTEWVESCLAIARVGGIGAPISADATAGEVRYRLADSASRIVITTGERSATLASLRTDLPALQEVIVVDDSQRHGTQGHRYEELASRSAASAPSDVSSLDAPAWILYTSGTTGQAKGVLLTPRSMLWVVAACWAPIVGLSESDSVLSPLPLFHSYGFNLAVLGVLAVGASAFLMERYSTRECLALLRNEPFTLFPGVPTMFHYLLEGAGGEPMRCAALRCCVSAGAIMSASLNRAFEERFSVPLFDGYGITETSTMVTMNWATGARIMGSCGLPLPGLAVRIVDPVTDRDVEPSEEGELIVRGPNLMQGYHDKPAETAAALKAGWYRTGDLATCDRHGYITITGRLKELIIRGGQNIAPAEVEEVVSAYEGVLDCAVIGVAHGHLGEVPVVCVVEKPGHSVDAAGLLAHCRIHLSAYKIPVSVHLVQEIPRTGSGKIMRFKLREQLAV